MFLTDVVTACRAILAIGSFIKDAYTFYDQDYITSELSALGINVNQREQIYVANKTACVQLCDRITLCQADILRLQQSYQRSSSPSSLSSSSSSPSSSLPSHLLTHEQSLLSIFQSARKLIYRNILPQNLSWLKQQWWIANMILQSNEILQQVQRIQYHLDRALQALAFSLQVDLVISSSSSSSSSAEDDKSMTALEYTNLKRHILLHENSISETSMTLLQTLDPKTDEQQSIEMSLSMAMNSPDQLDPRVIALQLPQRMKSIQYTSKQSQQHQHQIILCKLISSLEQQIKQQHQWNDSFQQLHSEMKQFVTHLQQHTKAIISHVDQAVAKQNIELKESIKELLQQNLTALSRQVLMAMQQMVASVVAEGGRVERGDAISPSVSASSSSSSSSSSPLSPTSSSSSSVSTPPPDPLPPWKYKFVRFSRHQLRIDYQDDGSVLGEGATGTVFRGRLLVGKRIEQVAFKRFTVSDTMKRTLEKIQGMNTTQILNHSEVADDRGMGDGKLGSFFSSSLSPPPSSPSSSSLSSSGEMKHMIAKVVREARFAWSLNGHPNCVSLYGVCLDPESCGIIMQLCNEGMLQSSLYRTSKGGTEFETLKRLSFDEKVICTSQILAGISFLHSRGIVHRDIKSANILVHNYGSKELPLYSFKLNDFGSARATKDYMSSMSSIQSTTMSVSQTAFTLRWEPCEIDEINPSMTKEEQKAIVNNPAVDVYAFGCLLGEIFYGLPPYSDFLSKRDIQRAQRNEKFTPFNFGPNAVSGSGDPIHPQLVSLIQRCCSRNPHDRPSISQIQLHDWPVVALALTDHKRSSRPSNIDIDDHDSSLKVITPRSTPTNNVTQLHPPSPPTPRSVPLYVPPSPPSPSAAPPPSFSPVHLIPPLLPSTPRPIRAAEPVDLSGESPSHSSYKPSLHPPASHLPPPLPPVSPVSPNSTLFAPVSPISPSTPPSPSYDQDDRLLSKLDSFENVGDVISFMRKYQGWCSVQEKGCAILANLSFNNVTNKGTIAAEGGITAIIEAMQIQLSSLAVQQKCCIALGNLAFNNQMIQEQVASAGGIEVILSAMQRHISSSLLQEKGVGALGNLAVNNTQNQNKIAYLGGITSIITSMKLHLISPEVQEKSCGAIANLIVNNPGNKIIVAKAGGIDAILAAMSNHPQAPAVQEKACASLGNLASNNTDNTKYIVSSDGISLIISAMRQYPHLPRLQEYACGALGKLAATNKSINDTIIAKDGISLILTARQKHPQSPSLQQQATAALTTLQSRSPTSNQR